MLDYLKDLDQPQKPNYAGFVVVGAGLSRTGTLSLRTALGILLNGPCYHGASAIIAKPSDPDLNHWSKAEDGRLRKRDWINFLEGRGYRSGVDFPLAKHYKEVMEAYPNAKVILTKRDPSKWYKSYRNTVFPIFMDMMRPGIFQLPIVLFTKLTGVYANMDWLYPNVKEMFTAVEKGEEASIQFFNDWVEDVIQTVPKEKLLVYEVKEGWGPLCKFLGVPVPNQPFPNVNDSAEFKSRTFKLRLLSYLVIVGIPCLIAVVMGIFLTYYY